MPTPLRGVLSARCGGWPHGGEAQCDGGRIPGVWQAGQSVSNTLVHWAPPSRPFPRLVRGRGSGRSNSLPLDSAFRFLNVEDFGADDLWAESVSGCVSVFETGH